MLTTRERFLTLAAGAAATLGLPEVAEARRRPVSEADVSKLYEAAKKEGVVVWWTAHFAQEAAEAIRGAFKAKYPGIDVQFIRQTAQVIYQRLSQDLKAGVHEVDVFASTDEAHYVTLKKQNVFAEFQPGDIDKLPAAFRNLDPDGTYQLGSLAFIIINYNPAKIKPATRWSEFSEPRFKGQITLGHPAFSGYVGNWVVAMNDKYGWDYFKKLALNNPKINRSINDTVTDILGGERTMGAGPDNLSLFKKAAGNSIDVVYPQDDAVLIVAPVAVMKDAPHPNAGRLFENFMYSREYSQELAKQGHFPLRGEVRSINGLTLDKIKWTRVKAERLATGVPEVRDKWRETFGV